MIFSKHPSEPETILPARCAVTGSPFAIRVTVKDGRAVAEEGRRVSPGSPGQNPGNLVKIQLANGITVSRTYHCPHCGNKNFVKCAKCGQVSCHDGSGQSTCPFCGLTNRVGGIIQSITVQNPGAKSEVKGVKPEPKY